MSLAYRQRLGRAKYLLDIGDLGEAAKVANECIEDSPEDPLAVFLCAQSAFKQGRLGEASILYDRASVLDPERPEIWNNLGCALIYIDRERAKKCFLKAWQYDKKDVIAIANMVSIEAGAGEHKRALAWADKALEIDPFNKDALYNSALSMLAEGSWKEGWERYRVSLGNRFREPRNYHQGMETPRWPGKGGTVVIYGEQGLGDEIMFASMIDRAVKNADRVIIDCDEKLKGLFQRSFPETTVYGTRWSEGVTWPPKEGVTHRMEIGGLGELYAPQPFRRGAYLKPCPQRKLQYKALLKSMDKKTLKVGIAWNAGSRTTEGARRSLTVEQLKPILDVKGVEFISLEYKNPAEAIAGTTIHHFPWATLTRDYDDTAALVSELDLVIAPTTTVVDLCGSLGKECWVIAPECPPWRYWGDTDQMYFYKSVKVFRKDGRWPIGEVADCLSQRVTAS